MDQNIDNPSPIDENQPPQPEPAAPEQVAPEPATAPEPPTAEATMDISQDSKNMGMLCHLLAIFTVFLCPLLIWLIKKDEDKFVDSQGKEALNFQITVMFAMIASWILMPVLIGFFLFFATVICDFVFCILASVAANKGKAYRYPLCIRIIK
jgi:uncharacterized Tic20 family protein